MFLRKQMFFISACTLLAVVLLSSAGCVTNRPNHDSWAKTPPMGWNSWDYYGTTVTEAQTKEQADYMAANLKSHGWQYIVVDIQWYEPKSRGHSYRKDAQLTMDEYSRLIPAVEKFPSAANGAGFKSLADYVHSKGLKFGIHMMRGIPRQAVRENTPILGTSLRARDIANTNSICRWNSDMYGVDTTKPGGQAYYDSIFQLLASWGVDFVKVDDLSRPYDAVQKGEIEAIRKAIDKCGRPIVFSTSPGATPLREGPHISTYANMWRVSDDFWDNWPSLLAQFKRLNDWTPYRGPGHFPDADMLPLGKISFGRDTRFTRDEQFTLMTLWCIARSPLILGNDMTQSDPFTLSLITNDEVLAVNQHSSNNHQLFRTSDGHIAWVADVPDSSDKYLAVFNIQDAPKTKVADAYTIIPVKLQDIGFSGPVKIRDLWLQQDLGIFTSEFAPKIPFHGAGLFRLIPVK